ncbi:MAG: CPBP family intramembrane metalloprotease [Natronomonas sp.]
MTRWGVFAGITLSVLLFLLALARLSQPALDGVRPLTRGERRRLDRLPDGTDHLEAVAVDTQPSTPAERTLSAAPSTELLFVNVALSQGLFGVVLLAGVWLSGVPSSALGVGAGVMTLRDELLAGIALGIALSFANTLAGGLAKAFGADPAEGLRGLLTPDSTAGWVVLLVVVLPIVAGFEELLFRAALIGAFEAGFGVSPWLLVVLSSVAFALGHGAQGRLGVIVTGSLGIVLGTAFVVTNSLLVVVVAHYLVNAVEFVVFEGLGVEPFGE